MTVDMSTAWELHWSMVDVVGLLTAYAILSVGGQEWESSCAIPGLSN